MSVTVLALVVAAAFAHAGWNLVAKPAVGGAAFVWLCAVAGTLTYLPVLVVALLADPGRRPWAPGRCSRCSRAWTISRMRAAVVGLLSPLAYVLVLYALAHAPVSYVAPARESSIVVGTLLGVLVLHEMDSGRRLAAAAAILVGVIVLTLGPYRRTQRRAGVGTTSDARAATRARRPPARGAAACPG